jgi:hypothetical protein
MGRAGRHFAPGVMEQRNLTSAKHHPGDDQRAEGVFAVVGRWCQLSVMQ